MAYVFLLLSNTFTVVEEFWFSDFFNLLEHCSIMGSSVCMLVAILQLTTGEKRILDEEKLNGRTGKEDA
ncbi:MAG: hypothetical protein JXR97_05370 [Planctomycetes bacterium]|nr:hypothetical protein [Planctomycetota bacterium]